MEQEKNSKKRIHHKDEGTVTLQLLATSSKLLRVAVEAKVNLENGEVKFFLDEKNFQKLKKLDQSE